MAEGRGTDVKCWWSSTGHVVSSGSSKRKPVLTELELGVHREGKARIVV